MFRCLLAVSLAVVAGLSPAAGAASDDNPHVWKPEVKSVAVFKNGLGFFIAEGDARLRDGWCVSGAVPPAVFGTFAVYSVDETRTVDVVGSGSGETVEFDGADGPKDAAGKRARLEPYKGLNLSLTFKHDDRAETAVGKLVEIGGEYVILNQENRLNAVRLAELTRMQVLDYPLRVHVDSAKPANEAPARLGMAYLRKGVTWIPEYTLKIVDDTTAELTLRGTLINEAEDLVGTDVHFVVGVPHFLHSELLTPLALGQAIRAVAAAVPSQYLSQTIASNAIVSRAAAAADQRSPEPAAPAPPAADPSDTGAERVATATRGLPQMGGAGASDFAVYTKSGMTVRRGEKAIVTLFRQRIRYSHFYRWSSPGELRHFLVLHNETDTPWTTGPVVAVSERRPLCQDAIHYTPRGSRYELPVTTAVNVATQAADSESDRKLKAHEPSPGHFLDLVTIDGRVRVTNHEARPIELEVQRSVPGLIRSASDAGRIAQDTDKLVLTERQGSITWRVTVPPKEMKELTYRYERYVPSK